MKRTVLLAAMLLTAAAVQAQKYATYYYQRTTLFEVLPARSSDIIFLGNSITDGCEWHELFDSPKIKNRGISADIAEGVLDRLETITKGHPAKIFIMIGTNDLARGISVDQTVGNITRIVDRIAAESPSTRIYLQSILPVSAHFGRFEGHTSKGADIREANARLKSMAAEKGITYIDLHRLFTDPQTGDMNLAYTNDGLHLNGQGYILWRDAVSPYVKESKKSYVKRNRQQ